MKFIVVSDIHGAVARLERVLDMHRDADGLIFLGDGLRELSAADAYSRGFTVFAVKGNCDGLLLPGGIAENEMTVSFEGYRFFMLHGHTRGVKSGLDRAILAANERQADILLYGHTHIPVEKYLPEGSEFEGGVLTKPLRIFNPGSLGASGDGKGHFGLIQISNGNILLSHGAI